jgi:Putative Flp pilus-assembly TadE/G-like
MVAVRTGSTRRGDEGQILPVLLVAFVAILAVGLVLFQVGAATSIRAQAQTAVDSAALAGAKSSDSPRSAAR